MGHGRTDHDRARVQRGGGTWDTIVEAEGVNADTNFAGCGSTGGSGVHAAVATDTQCPRPWLRTAQHCRLLIATDDRVLEAVATNSTAIHGQRSDARHYAHSHK